MEPKITLYNSNDEKIGETYMRRAKQLVRQQRAMWTDEYHTAIRFAPGKENLDKSPHIAEFKLKINELCFAPFMDGYYYPAVISDILPKPGIVKVVFLDTWTGKAQPDKILSLSEGFESLDFQCRFGWLGFYKGVIANLEPIIFHFDDGEVSHASLSDLRGY